MLGLKVGVHGGPATRQPDEPLAKSAPELADRASKVVRGVGVVQDRGTHAEQALGVYEKRLAAAVAAGDAAKQGIAHFELGKAHEATGEAEQVKKAGGKKLKKEAHGGARRRTEAAIEAARAK